MPVDDGMFVCYSSIDCTDMPITEKPPFDPGWMSHKFRGAGVRYEVCLSLSGSIVWVNGPFMAGANSDLSIFRNKLKSKLISNEVM